MIRKILLLIFFIPTTVFLPARELGFFETASVYIPEGWDTIGNEPDKVTFADPTNHAYLQIKRYY